MEIFKLSITVNSIEPMFCMCGSVVRKCTYCDKEFEEGPHPNEVNSIIAIKNGLIKSDIIKCIFCGNPTNDTDRICRNTFDAKRLFHARNK